MVNGYFKVTACTEGANPRDPDTFGPTAPIQAVDKRHYDSLSLKRFTNWLYPFATTNRAAMSIAHAAAKQKLAEVEKRIGRDGSVTLTTYMNGYLEEVPEAAA